MVKQARCAFGLVIGKTWPLGTVLATGLQWSTMLVIVGTKPPGLNWFFSTTPDGILKPVPEAV